MRTPRTPLKFTVLGVDSHMVNSLFQQVLSAFPNECIGNSFIDLQCGLKEIKAAPPDLILLQSQKPRTDIMELHNAYLGKPPDIILILEPGIKLKTNSIHPSIIKIMKSPVENKEIRQSISALLKEKKEVVFGKGKRKDEETILLSMGTGWQLLKVKDIVRLNSDGNYITFHTINDEKFTVIKTMKYYEEKLPKSLFFRVHQSHIINFMHIEKVTICDGYSIILKDGSSVPLSKERKENFKLFLQQKCIS